MNLDEKTRYKVLFKVAREDLDAYEKKAIYFGKPLLVALFDYNYGRITKANRMKYLKLPESYQYPIDLNVDLESYILRNPTLNDQNIDLILKYIMSSSSNFECGGNSRTRLITRSGALVYLMELSQNRRINVKKLRVSRYKNNLYMISVDTVEPLKEINSVNTHHLQMENNFFADSPCATLKAVGTCDENRMLTGVQRSSFGMYDVFYSVNIQGIMDDEKIINFDHVDALSDRRFVFTKQMWKSLENRDNKYLRFWVQSYLANVRDIFIGLKSSTGIMEEPPKHMKAKDLPNNCYWKPSICTGFLHHFLRNVENRMSSVNCPNTVYEFSFNGKTKCFTYEVYEGKSDKSFISEEYQKFCSNL